MLRKPPTPKSRCITNNFAYCMECTCRDDCVGVGELMRSSAGKLAAASADFVICPDNPIQQTLRPEVLERSPLPWLKAR